MKKLSSGELVTLTRKGNQRAAQELVERHAKSLFGFIYRSVGQKEAAEDIFQDTFVSVFRSIHRYKEKGNFKAWLFRIAHNQVIDYIRKSKFSVYDLVDETSIPERRNDPLEKIVAKEKRARILQLVNKLPEKQKTVFLLRLESGLSFKEIAKSLNCSINTVIGRMHYALRKLKEGLISDEKQMPR